MLGAIGALRLIASNVCPELQQIGFRHLAFSAAGSTLSQHPHQLPRPPLPQLVVPEHEIEEGLPQLTAWLRESNGTNFCHKLRKGGLTPCVLFSLPGNQSVSLSVDSKSAAKLVRIHGRNGLQAQVLRLNIMQQQQQNQQQPQGHLESSSSSSGSSSSDAASRTPPQRQRQPPPQLLASVRVLPKAVHMNSVTLEVENFRLMFCPPERSVRVQVPIKLWNDDISPGVKAGGWLHVVNRTVPLSCQGSAIRPFLELDMRHMQLKEVLRFQDVPLPPGCRLAVKDPLQPVVRCAARVGGD